MILELGPLFAAAVGYLLLLFLIAYATERGLIPNRLARHPLTYALSLGVYASSWTYYGSVGFARANGYNFLTIYLGVTLSCLLVPVLWMPIVGEFRGRRLTALADLFAFRYQSQAAGVLAAVFVIACNLPYLALQIRAVTESVGVLTSAPPGAVGLVFCGLVTLFAILFGARHLTPRERHEGLVVAIAFESVVKLAALLLVAAVATFWVLGGLSGVDEWLRTHPQALEAMYRPVRQGPWGTLMLLAFAAAFLLPRKFHMAFCEGVDERALKVASWAFPLFLLALNLAVPVILWAGTKVWPDGNPDFYVLAVARSGGSRLLSGIAFLGGVSAASAMVIVDTLALAAMCLKHLVLPKLSLANSADLYGALLWIRRLLIGSIILAGYWAAVMLDRHRGLVELGLISFVAVAQFLPGLFGVLFWQRSTRQGFIAGLLGGVTLWVVTLFLPLLVRSEVLPQAWDFSHWFGMEPGKEPWSIATFSSLSINGLLFGVVSLLTRAKPAEKEAASACAKQVLAPRPVVVAASSPREFQERLERLRESRVDLPGGAAELESFRRYFRRILEDLPLGVCALGPDRDVVIWNRALEQISGIDGARVVGTRLDKVPEALGGLLISFADQGEARQEVRLVISEHERPFSLSKSVIDAAALPRLSSGAPGGLVILVEDLSERKALAAQVAHQDRLASIGRLAAGVAHEIGNPLTGIACVAQNLAMETEPEAIRARLGLILEQAQRIDRIVRGLLRFSRAGTGASLDPVENEEHT